jgi:hypothetical protein
LGSDSRSGIFEDPAGITGRCAASWVGALAVEGFLLARSAARVPWLSAFGCVRVRSEAICDSAGGDGTAADRDGFGVFISARAACLAVWQVGEEA